MKKIIKYFPRSLFFHLLLIFVLAYLLQLFNDFDWGAGFQRGLVLLAIVFFIVIKKHIKLPQIVAKLEIALLYFILIILSYKQISYFLEYYDSSYPNDIGESSILALELFWKSFKNPYIHSVDKVSISHPGLFLEGYKYFPLTFLLYSPLVLTLKLKGLYISNFIFHILTIFFIFKIASHLKNNNKAYHPIIPVILYLSSNLVLLELFRQGVNDIIPTLLILMSYYYFLKNDETFSALFLGASISSKLLPGPLFLLLLFPQIKDKKKYLLYSIGIFALIVLPFLFWNYKGMVSNTIIYFVMKPGDSTGFLHGFNVVWSIIIFISFAFLFLSVLIYYYLRNRFKKHAIIFYFTILLTFSTLPLKENHRNHLIWLIPFFSLSFNLLPEEKKYNSKK